MQSVSQSFERIFVRTADKATVIVRFLFFILNSQWKIYYLIPSSAFFCFFTVKTQNISDLIGRKTACIFAVFLIVTAQIL